MTFKTSYMNFIKNRLLKESLFFSALLLGVIENIEKKYKRKIETSCAKTHRDRHVHAHIPQLF